MSPDELHAEIRRFVHEIVLPQVGAWDRADDLPAEALDRLVALGLTGALLAGDDA